MKKHISIFYQSIAKINFTIVLVLLSHSSLLKAQESAKEEDFFRIFKVRSPEGTLLEVGGLCTLPNGDLAVTTRRGCLLYTSSVKIIVN